MACERYALSLAAVSALLMGCAGSSTVALPSARETAATFSHHQTFPYTGTPQTFTVPAGVTTLKVVAQGGNGAPVSDTPGGYGGRVTATFTVTPQEQLTVYVGGDGSKTTGGFNGGAAGGYGTYEFSKSGAGGGGGGASDVRTGTGKLKDRIIVAGGGGGAGGNYSGPFGGQGGNLIGGSGGSTCPYLCGGAGQGGTQKTGGSGGRGNQDGQNGALGTGGAGGGGVYSRYYAGGGGGGGGGYYGGGGGGGGWAFRASSFGTGGGAGGGSSYVATGAKSVRMWQGYKAAQTVIVFSW